MSRSFYHYVFFFLSTLGVVMLLGRTIPQNRVRAEEIFEAEEVYEEFEEHMDQMHEEEEEHEEENEHEEEGERAYEHEYEEMEEHHEEEADTCTTYLGLCEGSAGSDAWEQCMVSQGAPADCMRGRGENESAYEEVGGYEQFAECKPIYKACEQGGGDWKACVKRENIVCLGGMETKMEMNKGDFLDECIARASEEFKARAMEAGITVPENSFEERARQMCAGQSFFEEHRDVSPGPLHREERDGDQGANTASILAQAAGRIVELSQRPNLSEEMREMLKAAAQAVGILLVRAAQGEPIASLMPTLKEAVGPVLAALSGGPGFADGHKYGSQGTMGPGMGGGVPSMFLPDSTAMRKKMQFMLENAEKMLGVTYKAFPYMEELFAKEGVEVSFEGWEDMHRDLTSILDENLREACERAIEGENQEECFSGLRNLFERIEGLRVFAESVLSTQNVPPALQEKVMQQVGRELFGKFEGPESGMMEGGAMRPGMMGPRKMMTPGMSMDTEVNCMHLGIEERKECFRNRIPEEYRGEGPGSFGRGTGPEHTFPAEGGPEGMRMDRPWMRSDADGGRNDYTYPSYPLPSSDQPPAQ